MRVARIAVGTLCALALLWTLPLVAPVASAADGSEAAAAPRRPNVLVIVSDDQAWSTFSRKLMPAVYSQLVDRGVLFRRAYVSTSLCCPSRAEILTGLYEHDTGVDDNDVPLTRPTIVEALQDQGYRTYLSGKYLNSWNDCAPRPEFDEWACVVSHEPSSNSLKDPYVNVNGDWIPFIGYQPDVLGSLLADDIRSTPDDQPFFALYTPTTPHLPADDLRATPDDQPFFALYTPTTPHLPADDPRYDDLPVSPPRGGAFDANTLAGNAPRFARRTPLTDDEIAKSDERYEAMAHATRSFDDAVASLLDALGGRAQDTMVVYLSDNGFLYGEHRRFGKNDAWEEATRVPMVVRYPAALPAERSFVSKALVQNVDIAPTIADLVGFPWGADGRSFLPIVARDRASVRNAALLEHCRGVNRGSLDCSGLLYEGGNTNTAGFEGVVTPRYKYLRYDDGSVQLTDLRRDPREQRNLLGTGRGRGGGGGPGSKRALALAHQLSGRLASLTRPAVQTTIAAGPGALDARVATFRYFSPSLMADYRCRLVQDGHAGDWQPCPGERISYSNLADGQYRFEVAGSDGAGHRDPTPAARAFSIETRHGPAISLGAHPDAFLSDGSASFSYTSDLASAQFQCRLTGPGASGELAPCPPGGVGYSGLADGDYVFQVVARDPSTGEESRPAAGWSFRVDHAGPVIAFLAAPSVATRADRATFRFVFDEPTAGAVRCSVDNGPATDCASGTYRVDRANVGIHNLSVTATDRAGNASIGRYRWEVDRTAPAVGIKGNPRPLSNERDARFDLWSDANPAFYLCRLDDGPWMPCFTAAELTSLKEGKHRFVAVALDAAMNRSEPVAFHWTVDTIAPGVVLTGSPQQGETTTSGSASFDLVANETVATYLCSLDGAAYASCGPHASYSGLGTGSHSFSAYVVDRAGNESIVVGRTWTVV